MYQPAQLLDQVLCTSADLLGELNDIDSFEDDVVCPHWVRAREWRAAGTCMWSTCACACTT